MWECEIEQRGGLKLSTVKETINGNKSRISSLFLVLFFFSSQDKLRFPFSGNVLYGVSQHGHVFLSHPYLM